MKVAPRRNAVFFELLAHRQRLRPEQRASAADVPGRSPRGGRVGEMADGTNSFGVRPGPVLGLHATDLLSR